MKSTAGLPQMMMTTTRRSTAQKEREPQSPGKICCGIPNEMSEHCKGAKYCSGSRSSARDLPTLSLWRLALARGRVKESPQVAQARRQLPSVGGENFVLHSLPYTARFYGNSSTNPFHSIVLGSGFHMS